MFEEYAKLTKSTIEKDIAKEFSGDIKNAFIAIAKIAINPMEYFADRLHKSMKGLGTNDRALIRVSFN